MNFTPNHDIYVSDCRAWANDLFCAAHETNDLIGAEKPVKADGLQLPSVIMQQMVGIAALKMASPARPIRVATSSNLSQMGLSSAAVLAQRDVKTGA